MTKGNYLVAIMTVAMLRGRTPKVNLSSTFVCLFLSGLVMFPSAGCLTPPLLFGLLC
jgi:hypothetical protein